MKQITKNCHFISRFLTKPWEVGERKLRYYDFPTDRFDQGPSKGLYAADGINTQEVEDWLNRFLETPLSAIRPRLVKGDPSALDEWQFYRAAVLMLWLQGARTQGERDRDASRELEALARLNEDELDALASKIRDDYHLVLVFTVGTNATYAPLFFPSTGLFHFACPDSSSASGFCLAIGMPLATECALVAIPAESVGADPPSLDDLPPRLSKLSVGAAGKQVVLPPGLLEETNEADLRNVLQELRTLNAECIESVAKLADLKAHVFSLAGLDVDVAPNRRVHSEEGESK